MPDDITVGKLLDGSFSELRQDLREMRQEQRDGYKTLSGKIDETLEKLSEHTLSDVKALSSLDGRLAVVEGTRRSVRWLVGTGIVGVTGAVADFFFNHLPRYFK